MSDHYDRYNGMEKFLRDTQYNILGANLAEVGTDCISRQAAIEALKNRQDDGKGDISRFYNTIIQHDIEAIEQLPPAQPEPLQPWEVLAAQVVLSQPDIIRCKDCKHRWTHKCMDSMPIERCDLGQTFYDAEVDYCSLAERREVTT